MHLFVLLFLDVDAVDFDDAIADAQAGGERHRSLVDFADVVAVAGLVVHQVEAVAFVQVALDDVAEARRRRRTDFLHHQIIIDLVRYRIS